MSVVKFAAPEPTALTKPYWDACNKGRLVVQKCKTCGKVQFPPLPLCGDCQSSDLRWAKASGRGVLYVASVVHRPQIKGADAPYTVAIADMEEGWRLISNLVDMDGAEACIGMKVRVSFRATQSGQKVPLLIADTA